MTTDEGDKLKPWRTRGALPSCLSLENESCIGDRDRAAKGTLDYEVAAQECYIVWSHMGVT